MTVDDAGSDAPSEKTIRTINVFITALNRLQKVTIRLVIQRRILETSEKTRNRMAYLISPLNVIQKVTTINVSRPPSALPGRFPADKRFFQITFI
jgi:hypothetical protein